MQPPYYPGPPQGYPGPQQGYPGPPQGYPGPPPAPKRGLPAIFIVLIVIGSLGLAFAAAGVAISMQKSGAPADPGGVALSQSYATPNGLLTAHYPADFAAKTLDHATLVVSRNFGGGEDEVVTLAAVKDPITNDPAELARILDGLVEKNVITKGGTYKQTSHRPAKCLGIHPGVELEMTFKLPTVQAYVSKACFFINASKGYEVRYDVPSSRAANEVVLLQRIIGATVLTP
jgi:hypothetical protein